MSIRFAILGLLAVEPLHGYAIQSALEEHFGDVCEPSYGEVYRVLDALARDRLVAPVAARIGNRPRRKVYSLTTEGGAALRRWLFSAPAAGRARDDTWLRLLIAERVAPELLPQLIDALVQGNRAYQSELDSLRRTSGTARSFADLVRALRLASDIRHARARADALDLCRTTLARRLAGATDAELARLLSTERDHDPPPRGAGPPAKADARR